MKRSDWKIILAAIIYTMVFYQQDIGLNHFIFSIVMCVLAALQNIKNIKKPTWLFVATATLISGFFVFYYGTNLPYIANIISLIFLAGITFHPNISLLHTALNGLLSLLLSIPFLLINFFRNKFSSKQEDPKQEGKKSIFKKLLLLLFPLFVVFIFFILYQDSNPLFQKITEDFNLDWLSFRFVRHCMIALFFMYSFFVQHSIKKLVSFDQNLSDQLDIIDESQHNKSFISKLLSLDSELFMAVSLFIMLNLLIAFLNGVDIYFLWLGNSLEQGLVYSQYLHSGTIALITSILLAILIIVFFFRGVLNFDSKGKVLRILAMVWVVQNIVMIGSAILRNKMYIAQYGLTHKRLGVYVFLVLAIIGLIFTFIKVAKKKNTIFLFRKNAWAFYTVLILACFFDWDTIITKNNIELTSKNKIVSLDKQYLGNLSHSNAAVLATIEASHYTPNDIYNNTSYGSYNISPFQQKIRKLLEYNKRSHWQELCLNKEKNLEKLKALNEQSKINQFVIQSLYLEQIPTYESLSNIRALDLHQNSLNNRLKALAFYTKLEVLNLAENDIYSLDSLPKLDQLSKLNLAKNHIVDFGGLAQLNNLKKLNISSNSAEIKKDNFPTLAYLESIDISNSKFQSWQFLARQPILKELIYKNSKCKKITIPKLKQLEKVDLTNSTLIYSNYSILDSLSKSKNILELNLSQCHIESTYYLLDQETEKAYFQNLQKLNLSNCYLSNYLKPIKKYKQLVELNLNNNNIVDLEALQSLKNLKSLSLSNTGVKDKNIKALQKIKALENLKISALYIKNIDPIFEIKNLKNLECSNNNIENIDSIIKLTELKKLDISMNKIENMDVLQKLKNLKWLKIDGNTIEDYRFLYNMKQLEYISIGVVDLSIVEELKKQLPNTEIDYYSINLKKNISYSTKNAIDFSTSI